MHFLKTYHRLLSCSSLYQQVPKKQYRSCEESELKELINELKETGNYQFWYLMEYPD